jgi:hypothetical protein
MKLLKIPFLLSLIMALSIVSCKVAFVPKSSAEAIANVHQLQTDVASLYDGYISASDKSFDESRYADVGSEIDNLVLLENTRDKAKNIIRQAVLIQNTFAQYRGEHKAKGVVNDHQFRIYKKYLQSLIKPLEVSELSLK